MIQALAVVGVITCGLVVAIVIGWFGQWVERRMG